MALLDIFKKKPKALPVEIPAGNQFGVNLSPTSNQSKLNKVSRIIILRRAQAKAGKKGDEERVNILDIERKRLRMELTSIGMVLPDDLGDLLELRNELLRAINGPGAQ